MKTVKEPKPPFPWKALARYVGRTAAQLGKVLIALAAAVGLITGSSGEDRQILSILGTILVLYFIAQACVWHPWHRKEYRKCVRSEREAWLAMVAASDLSLLRASEAPAADGLLRAAQPMAGEDPDRLLRPAPSVDGEGAGR